MLNLCLNGKVLEVFWFHLGGFLPYLIDISEHSRNEHTPLEKSHNYQTDHKQGTLEPTNVTHQLEQAIYLPRSHLEPFVISNKDLDDFSFTCVFLIIGSIILDLIEINVNFLTKLDERIFKFQL
mmetsp:Transcript_32148/g.31465  ORF Transcript_32148/g.31465 Transcript_32148/m.31465 type:complete len:124 (-) Transcript_32148:260-631(-)